MTLSFEMNQANSTLEHIRNVQALIRNCITGLLNRSISHDSSKFSESEWPTFLKHTKTLSGLTYGSDEYKAALDEMRPALENHYKRNSHHPEYYPNGIQGMSLLGLLEMLCDWMAATMRHKDGDIIKSIEINQERFGYSDDVKQILLNTVREVSGPPKPLRK
jgi:hypothetical protein